MHYEVGLSLEVVQRTWLIGRSSEWHWEFLRGHVQLANDHMAVTGLGGQLSPLQSWFGHGNLSMHLLVDYAIVQDMPCWLYVRHYVCMIILLYLQGYRHLVLSCHYIRSLLLPILPYLLLCQLVWRIICHCQHMVPKPGDSQILYKSQPLTLLMLLQNPRQDEPGDRL